MRLDEVYLAEALRGACGVPPEDVLIRGVAADSRRCAPGFAFFAVKGSKTDGMAHWRDAVARGAIAVIADEGTDRPSDLQGALFVTAPDARLALARAASTLFPFPPENIVAVTGTNGKTSTVDFCRQLWRMEHGPAASIGTLGAIVGETCVRPGLTTPDPVQLAETLDLLGEEYGVNWVAVEASSHGLDQRRLDGLRLAGAGFTNLSRDHLDYHGTMESYRAAKLRLFSELLWTGQPAVFHAGMEAETLAEIRRTCAARRLRAIAVGAEDSDIRVLNHRALPTGQAMTVEAFGIKAPVELALSGRFQADNVLIALGLVVGTGMQVTRALSLLPRLAAVRGRMELAARLPNGAAAYVDYAHTPDALERLLEALRPHVAPGARLHVLFGAGGDRDPGKRPLMGEAAARHADRVWVTDDNPRSEDPAAIRRAVLAGAGDGAVDAGEREAAIARALGALGPGDVLAVAGKGHEAGQEIAGRVLPFDDAEVVRRLVHGAAA